MGEQRSLNWSKLDNAAKAFPPTVKKSDTRVFRFSCELLENIDAETLQAALDAVIKEFPMFLCVMRQGLFWYYLEQCDLKPVVSPETEHPCEQLYKAGYKTLLFKVTYYKKRINLEMFHSLADGTGGMLFFRALVLKYITLRHSEDFDGDIPFLENDASVADKKKDSFSEYYQKIRKEKKARRERLPKPKKAYVFRGATREDDSLMVIEGDVSVKAAIALAHKYNTTLTGFITAAFIYAIGKELTAHNRSMPVVIGIPVNLRKYFSSQSSRNFFGMVNVAYTFREQNDSFEDIAAVVSEQMKQEITKDHLFRIINSYSNLEHNLFIRIAPLPFKDFVIRIARNSADCYATSVVSNLGVVDMPEVVRPYISAFGIISSTPRSQLCLCSFGDTLRLGFTTGFAESELAKNFFRTLTEMGLQTKISCNDFQSNMEND